MTLSLDSPVEASVRAREEIPLEACAEFCVGLSDGSEELCGAGLQARIDRTEPMNWIARSSGNFSKVIASSMTLYRVALMFTIDRWKTSCPAARADRGFRSVEVSSVR